MVISTSRSNSLNQLTAAQGAALGLPGAADGGDGGAGGGPGRSLDRARSWQEGAAATDSALHSCATSAASSLGPTPPVQRAGALIRKPSAAGGSGAERAALEAMPASKLLQLDALLRELQPLVAAAAERELQGQRALENQALASASTSRFLAEALERPPLLAGARLAAPSQASLGAVGSPGSGSGSPVASTSPPRTSPHSSPLAVRVPSPIRPTSPPLVASPTPQPVRMDRPSVMEKARRNSEPLVLRGSPLRHGATATKASPSASPELAPEMPPTISPGAIDRFRLGPSASSAGAVLPAPASLLSTAEAADMQI